MTDSHDRDSFPSPKDEYGTENPFVSPVAAAERRGGHGCVTQPEELLNPWVSMCLKPRATVRQQLETDPDKHVLLLAILGMGAAQISNGAPAMQADFAMRVLMLAVVMVAGAVLGLIWLYLVAWVVSVVGRWLGGVATARNCRTALAWSFVPTIWMLPVNAFMGVYYLVKGPEALMIPPDGADVAQQFNVFANHPAWMLPIFALGAIVGLWQIVIFTCSVGEAHQFSSLRGFGTLLLSMLVFSLVMFVILFAVIFLLGLLFMGLRAGFA